MATAQQDRKAPDATKAPDQLFRYSAWVHVGTGAQECEEGEAGSCANPLHFHAWCRLPNQLQHEDIRERALAAKARRIRQLRDPEADACAILDSDMAELERVVDVDALVEELLNKDWWKRQLDAIGELEELEDYKTIERDRERLADLRLMDPDARPADEYEELERHVGKYMDAIDARRAEIEQPMRSSLEALSKAQLIEQIREERILSESTNAFMETYSRYEWLAGTFTSADPLTRQRSFRDLDRLVDAAPEVLEAVKDTFAELESSLTRGPRGN